MITPVLNLQSINKFTTKKHHDNAPDYGAFKYYQHSVSVVDNGRRDFGSVALKSSLLW